MRTAIEILTAAAGQIGYSEGPNNDTKFGQWYGMNHQPWCAIFVTWCCAQAGMNEIHYAYCPTGAANFQNGKWGNWLSEVTSAQAGDVVFFKFTNRIDHTGMVESNPGDGTVFTIEGNTTNGVYRRHRRVSIAGFGRPRYDGAPAPTPAPAPTGGYTYVPPPMSAPMRGAASYDPRVAQLQARLAQLGFDPGGADGQFGPVTRRTVIAFQRAHGLSPDGVVGPNTGQALQG